VELQHKASSNLRIVFIKMDWKNKLPQIQNKLRFQLFSRKYDGMDRVFEVFTVFSI